MSLLEGYRLFTGNYIYESDIPSDQKLELIRFLKEADADDIIDILSGEYAVEGLTEDEMEVVNDVIEEKFGKHIGKVWSGKYGMKAGKDWAMKQGAAGMEKAKKAGKYAKEKSGWTAAGEKQAALKKQKGKMFPSKKKISAAKKERNIAVLKAVGKTAGAGAVAGGAGYGGYKGVQKMREK